jgi:hypothetical protein
MENSSNLRQPFKSFLSNNRFLPMVPNNHNWKNMQITHYRKKPDNKDIAEFRKQIKKQLQCGGVYAYLNTRKKLLYFGKANNIYTRVYSHYKEAYIPQDGDHLGAWDKFFYKNAGKLILLWRKVEYDRQRIAIEEMIEDVVRSKFDKQYPRGKRKMGAT